MATALLPRGLCGHVTDGGWSGRGLTHLESMERRSAAVGGTRSLAQAGPAALGSFVFQRTPKTWRPSESASRPERSPRRSTGRTHYARRRPPSGTSRTVTHEARVSSPCERTMRDHAQVTTNARQASGTPFSWWVPRSANPMPEPRTRSLTVDETTTSPALAKPMIRAPMWTAIPAT